jgi:hypothetical protein
VPSLIQALREPKVGPFALFDVSTALAGAWILGPKIGVPRERALFAAIPVGVLVHELFGVSTPLNRMVFGPGNAAAKLLVAALAIRAARG